jgi:RimJ/RimL family protein N-acetyltransferase
MFSIRLAEDDDLESLWRIINEPSVLEVMPLPRPVTKGRVKRWYGSAKRTAALQIFVLEVGEHVIGCLTLNKKGLITIWIDEAYQNKGYGTKALEWLMERAKEAGHDRLTCNCFKKNKLALNFYEKFGFARTGEKGKLVSMEKLL